MDLCKLLAGRGEQTIFLDNSLVRIFIFPDLLIILHLLNVYSG